MASYDNLMAEQPWQFRPPFSDAWFSDVFTRETETLTKALHNSLAGVSFGNGDVFSAEMLQSLYVKPDAMPIQTPTVSGVSENEPQVSKHHRRSAPASGGRVAKRKSRPSKRAAATTFITADPANFRRMVQQVTGVGFGGSNEQLSAAQILKPAEADRANYHAAQPGFGLPTLDTSSAFFVDGSASSQPSAEGGAAAAAEHYFDSFCSFPTLESWKQV